MIAAAVGASSGCTAHHEVVTSPDYAGMVSGDARDVATRLNAEVAECQKREQAAASDYEKNASSYSWARGIVAGVSTAVGAGGAITAYFAQSAADVGTKSTLTAIGGGVAAITPLAATGVMELVGLANWEPLSTAALAKAQVLKQRRQDADKVFRGLLPTLNGDQTAEPFKEAMTGARALVATSAAACRE